MQVISLLLMLLLVPSTGTALPIPTPQNVSVAGGSPSRVCLDAAKNALGPKAVILACGHLTGAAALEVVAATPLKGLRRTGAGVPVKRIMILRTGAPKWREVFVADARSMRNDLGLVQDNAGIPGTSSGFRVTFSDRPRDAPEAGFTLWLTFLSPGGHDEGVPVQISWNPAVKRFQEYSYYAGEGFKPEIRGARRGGSRGHAPDR